MAKTKQQFVQFKGGFVSEYAKNTLPNGVMTHCLNFEPTESGYQRADGYERFDGQDSPSLIAATNLDDTAREAQRALILAVPGSGAILGVAEYQGVTYAFRNAADGLSAKMYKESAAGWVEVVTGFTLTPSGSYEFVVYNFYAGASSSSLFGCDGVNKPFKFDGTTFTQLDTGMELLTPPLYPTHITAHQYHLFLAYQGSVVHSAPGAPSDFAVANGGGEVGVGSTINEMKTVKNDVLAIMMEDRVALLYGTSSLDWKAQEVKSQDEGVGGKPNSAHSMFGKMVYLDNQGITNLTATASFGNFIGATLSVAVKSYLDSAISNYARAYPVKNKNQYNLAFTSATTTEILVCRFIGKNVSFGKNIYPFVATCFFNGEDAAGKELILAGSSDGFVYKMETGTSFDGVDIEASVGTSYMQIGSLTQRKRFKRSVLAIDASADVEFRIKPEFSYGSLNVNSHRVNDVFASGGGGIWGVDNWNEFTWSGTIINFGHIETAGTGTSVAFAIHYKNKYDKAFTLNNMSIDYIPRRLER
ncbi:MAG: hypothetical protein PF495_11780 [Spirochaetales bacterium]|jgi:hypothetical protein|nr:hypothetical protein [Spirochaetales bacterium]